MEYIKRFLSDERGTSDTVFKLVLAVTVAAVILIILLQIMHVNHEAVIQGSTTIKNGTKVALTEGMKTLSD